MQLQSAKTRIKTQVALLEMFWGKITEKLKLNKMVFYRYFCFIIAIVDKVNWLGAINFMKHQINIVESNFC